MKRFFTLLTAIAVVFNAGAQLQFINYGSQNSINALVEEGNYLWVGTSGGVFKRDRSTGMLLATINSSNGLPCNSVTDIKIDANGNKWFATYGNGIGIFNASLNSWTYYNKDNGLASNFVTCLFIDQTNGVWATHETYGLDHFNGSTWEHFSTPQLPTNSGYSVLVDDIGNLWYGGDGGIGKRDFSGTWTYYYPSLRIVCITKDNNGNIWFGSTNGGLIRYTGSGWLQYTEVSTSNGLTSDFVRSVVIDLDGTIWCGNGMWNDDWLGVCKFDGSTWTQYTPHTMPTGLAHPIVSQIVIDAQGNKWFGTNNGLSRLDAATDKFNQPIRSLNNILSNYVNDLAIDRFGNKWFATDNGLSMYNSTTNVWTSYTTSNGLPGNEVRAVTCGAGSDIYIGTYGSGAAKFSSGTWTYYTNGSTGGNLPSDYVQAMKYDELNNTLWVGTAFGAAKMSGPGVWTKYKTTDGLIENDIVSVEALGNNIWFGGRSNGISHFNGSTFTNYTTADGLSNNSVWDINIDQYGATWIATSGGISKFSGGSWKKYSWAEGMPSTICNAIKADILGNIWIGVGQDASSGLLKFDGSKFANYTMQDGLPEYTVRCIAIDAQGNKWMGTYGGASKASCKAPLISFTGDKACFGAPAAKTTLTNTSENTDVTTKFYWDFGNNGSIDCKQKDTTYAFAGVGKYLIKLKAVNDQCADSIIDSIRVNSLPVLASLNKKRSVCAGSMTVLTPVISNYNAGLTYSYSWSDGQTGTSLTTGTAGKYIVTASNENCISKPDTFDLTIMNPYDESKICIVTVGKQTGKNVIVWERHAGHRTVSYNIYKMIGLGYMFVGNVPFDSAGQYVDYSSMPDVISSRYAISVVDSCGNESKKSPYVQTINLGASLGVDTSTAVLNWTPYVDEGKTFEPDFYYIFKGYSKATLVQIDSVSGNFTLYNDKHRNGATYYQIGVKKPSLCDATGLKAESGPYSQSLSNLAEFKSSASLIESDIALSVYPNPFTSVLNISCKLESASDVKIELINETGSTAATLQYSNMSAGHQLFEINAQDCNLTPGIYLIRITANDQIGMIRSNYLR